MITVSGAHVKDAIVECLCRGAKLCLEKPLMENDFKILWQFTVSRQRNFRSQIDINPPEKNHSITHTQSLGAELKKNYNNSEVETEDLDKYKGENFQKCRTNLEKQMRNISISSPHAFLFAVEVLLKISFVQMNSDKVTKERKERIQILENIQRRIMALIWETKRSQNFFLQMTYKTKL